ncbi:auxilin-related protein 1-like isoform X2 [Nymphaea colorata]|uniref:auxilin-related protein 1-like isoform X2 n=1 Tax=Nymphaea colorata TaxID=210225 RepID=UPI00129E4660|nr:auxilin-related protein 1-like isoform X2 [Nymphaea colorata]
MASGNGISDRSALVSPHVEDEYGEIFRSFTRRMKVPAVPFLEFSTDFDGGIAEISGDSYSDIFGGFGWDLAVSLEELIGGLMAGVGRKDAEEKARGNGEKKPLEKVPSRLHSFSAEQKIYSSENISMASNPASEQLHDEEKPFPRSYKMTDPPDKENCMNIIHAAEVDSVSRYISAVDGNFCSLENHNSDIQDAVAYSTCTVSNVSEEVSEIKPTTTILYDSSSSSYLPHMHGNNGKQDSSNTDTKSHHVEYAPSTCINSHSHADFPERGIDESDSREVFLTVAEINLQTQPTQLPPPSRPPPRLDIKRDSKKDSSTNNWRENHNLANSNTGYHRMAASETHVIEVALKPSLLPCLDVEMDANSAASASTAALKEVMDETRTKAKIAKESNERRRDILDNQKFLEASEGKRGMERKKSEADRGFFTFTPKMAPRETKHGGQENRQAKTNPPMEALELRQEHKSFYPGHGNEEKNFKGSSAVKGFDWQKMMITLDNGDHGEEDKGMMPPEENFILQEGEMRSYLAHIYREKLLGEGSNGVKGSSMWGTEKREHKLDEAQGWDVKEKTLNPAAVTYERKEAGNKLMSVPKIQCGEGNIGKRKKDELCKKAGQEIQQEGVKEKKKSPKQWKTNKEAQTVAAAWGTNAQEEKEHRLETVQEFGKQEQVQSSRERLTKNPAEQEETVRLRMDEKAYWHEKSDKVFEVFQDVNGATSKTQNAAKLIFKQETDDREKGVAQRLMDENSRTTEQVRYFTETPEREQNEKVQFDKESLETEAQKEMDELWRLEEEMEKLWRLEEELEDGRGKGRDNVELATQNANDKVIVEVCSTVEIAAVDREIAEVQETANAETCKKSEDAQAEFYEKLQEEKASSGPVLITVQATQDGAAAENWEQPVSDIIRESTAESTEFMQQAVAEMVASSIGDKQEKDDEPDLCNGTSLSMNSEWRSPMSNFSYGVSFEVATEKRQKARLERCKRTEDRMAKALAEMKARDILVEKEQAERNRLAEVLDCDIKRWSNGKEGNLRALLSTLQYILWPESGWNPIPLTEVITSAAVKKAYKKATLCLHPDKVQQKGASIQQKYISEKVFDLLKEAWNNFNSEER